MASRSRNLAARRKKHPLVLEFLERREVMAEDLLTSIAPGLRGSSANGQSWYRPSISADGQLIVFSSDASDLVARDTNGSSDVFLFDRGTNALRLISRGLQSQQTADGASSEASITPDGRFVVFTSHASDLPVTGPAPRTNPGPQVYRYEVSTGELRLVSLTADGTTSAVSGAASGVISDDGNHVAFSSFSNDVVSGLNATGQNLYVHNFTTGVTRAATVNQAGTQAVGGLLIDDNAHAVSLSPDGRYVVFASSSSELAAGDQNGDVEDVFRRDLVTGMTTLISRDSSGTTSAEQHVFVLPNALSDDGRYVVFQTVSNNIVSGDDNHAADIFLRDAVTETTTLVSRRSDGHVAGAASFWPAITGDGRYVTFASWASDLVGPGGDSGSGTDVFVFDRSDNSIDLVSTNPAGVGQNSGSLSYPPQISDDGRYVAWSTLQTGFAVVDTNGVDDVYLRDRTLGVTKLMSSRPGVPMAADGASQAPVLASDGTVLWMSQASDLVAQDNNRLTDLYLRGKDDSQAALLTARDQRFPAAHTSQAGGTLEDITPDGRYSIISSLAWNCIGAFCNQTAPNDLDPDTAALGAWTNLYLVDSQTGTKTTLTRYLAAGVYRTGSGDGFNGRISDDGAVIAFAQGTRFASAPLDPNTVDSNGPLSDVYVKLVGEASPRLISRTVATNHSADNASGFEVAVSPDGKWIAFTSSATDLTTDTDANGAIDLFLYDVTAGTVELISRSAGSSSSAAGASSDPMFTANSTTLLFRSTAPDLVSGLSDTNGAADIFAYSLTSHSPAAITVRPDGTATGNAGSLSSSDGPNFDANFDGRYVVFASTASDLVATDNNSEVDVFVHDMQTGTTRLISSLPSSAGSGNGASTSPSISSDGRYVAFVTQATDLLSSVTDNNGQTDVLLADLQNNTIELVSRTTAGGVGDDRSWNPKFHRDGASLTIISEASNLAVDNFGADSAMDADLFNYQINGGTLSLLSVDDSGANPSQRDSSDPGTFDRKSVSGNRWAVELRGDSQIVGDRNRDADVWLVSTAERGSIRGSLWNDQNGNGSRDLGEAGLAEILVFLDENGNGVWDDASEPGRWTDSSGAYRFDHQTTTTHQVRILVPGGMFLTSPIGGNPRAITLTPTNLAATGIDFGLTRAVSDLQPTVTTTTFATTFEQVPVTWRVANLGNIGVNAGWQLAIYLSNDGVLDGGDRLIGLQTFTQAIPAGNTVNGTTTVTIPTVANGDYRILLQVDRRKQIQTERNRTNDIATSSGLLHVETDNLQLGTSKELNITASRPQLAVEFISPVEGEVLFAASPVSDIISTTLEVLRRSANGAWQAIAQAAGPSAAAGISISCVVGDALLLVFGRADGGTGGRIRIAASQPALAVTEVEPRTVGKGASVTFTVSGFGMSPNTTAHLRTAAGSVVDATNIRFTDTTEIQATFDLSNAAVGDSVLIVRRDPRSAEFAIPIRITNVTPAQITSRFVVPEVTRAGRIGTFHYYYGNQGNVDAGPVLITLSSPNHIPFGFNPDGLQPDVPYTFLAVGNAPRAGVIPGNSEFGQSFRFVASDNEVRFTADILDSTALEALDWNWVSRRVDSTYKKAAQWNQIETALRTRIGSTWGSLIQALTGAADKLTGPAAAGRDVTLLINEIAREAAADVTTSVRGRITSTDPEWSPAGSSLRLMDMTTGEGFVTELNNRGEFTVPLMVAGTYRLILGDGLLSSGAKLTVAGGEHVSGLSFVAEKGSRLDGFVTDAAGGSIAAATITLTAADGRFWTTESLADGSYRFQGLPVGTLNATVSAGGFASRRMDGVVISGAGSIQNFTLENQSTIRGLLTLPVGVDLQWVSVQVEKLDGVTKPWRFSNTFSTADFEVTGLPAGTYNVSIMHNDVVGKVFPNIVVTAGGQADLGTVVLERAATITGVLTSLDPTVSVAGRLMILAIGNHEIQRTETDAGGRYTFFDLKAETYRVAAQVPGSASTRPTFTVTDGQQLDHADVELRFRSIVQGRASYGADRPLSHARVVLKEASGVIVSTVTDADGRFVFSEVDPGDYELFVGSSDSPWTSRFLLSGTSRETLDRNLVVDADTIVTGRILNSAQQPIDGAVVSLRRDGFVIATTHSQSDGSYRIILSSPSQFTINVEALTAAFNPSELLSIQLGETITRDFTAGSASLVITTSETEKLVGVLSRPFEAGSQIAGVVESSSGGLRFENLPPGDYVLRIDSQGSNRGAVQAVTLAAGINNLQINLAELGVLVGKVLDADSQPLAGATVVVRGVGPDAASFGTTTESDGTYRIERMPQGFYRVEGFAPSYQLKTVADQLITSATTVDFQLAHEDTRITGQVYDAATHLPVRGAYVQLYDAAKIVYGRNFTEADTGQFTLTGWFGGRAWLVAGAPGYDSVLLEFDVTEGIVNVTPPFELQFHVGDGDDGDGEEPEDPTIELPKKKPYETRQILPGEIKEYFYPEGYKTVEGSVLTGSTLTVVTPGLRQANTPEKVGPVQLDFVPNACAPNDPCQAIRDQVRNQLRSVNQFFDRIVFPAYSQMVFDFSSLITAMGMDVIASWELVESVIAPFASSAKQAAEEVSETALGAEIAKSVTEAIKAWDAELEADGAANRANAVANTAATGVLSLSTVHSLSNQGTHVKNPFERALRVLDVLKFITGLNTPNADAKLKESLQSYWQARGEYEIKKRRLAKLMEELERCEKRYGSAVPCPANNEPLPPQRGNGGAGRGRVVGSFDPNDIVGPAGYLDVHYVPSTSTLNYIIRFENDPLRATAPAQEVFVTHRLDDDLDLDSLQLAGFGFGTAEVELPQGLNSWNQIVSYHNADATPLNVSVNIELDRGQRTIRWSLRSLDPSTGLFPENPLAGFLPPNDASDHGAGFLTFSVKPKPGVLTGTAVTAKASIVFDSNTAIDTNEYLNTMDAESPSSTVASLPAASLQNIPVSWSGSDAVGGSGLVAYDILVSVNGGAWQTWLTRTTLTGAAYAGVVGNRYGFQAIAYDGAGWVESIQVAAETQTLVVDSNRLWQNTNKALDVSGDGFISAIDALILINELNVGTYNSSSGRLPVPAPAGSRPPYLDPSGDGFITALDALLVINYLNQSGAPEGEGSLPDKPEGEAARTWFDTGIDQVIWEVLNELDTERNRRLRR